MITRPTVSSGQIILLVSIFVTFINNQVFFTSLIQRLDIFSFSGMGYVATFYLLMVLILVLIFLSLGQKYLLKPLMIIVVIMAAVISYFNQALGIVFNVDMIRNIIETVKDNNQQEAIELLSQPLLVHLFWLGLIPSMIIVMIKIQYKKLTQEVVSRLLYGSGVTLLLLIMVMLNFKYVSYFSRENRDLRVWVNPVFPALSSYKYIEGTLSSKKQPFKKLGIHAVQNKQGKKRTVGIMVVGETARADHFSLNGYTRKTNPLLEGEDIINLSNVSSCGTSTAFSVPCMFSLMNRDDYSPDKASRQSNILDVLAKANIKSIWIDNNSSCKGVCERIETDNIRNNPDSSSEYYSDGEYYDEKLLEEMKPFIANNTADTLIVLHTLGSHGPSYHRRYPEKFAKFTPYCQKNSPQECSDEEVSNAYDNTLLYTDYILSQIIHFLKQNAEKYESFLVYVSDHGESLGENGVYLHGLPYFLAPKAQTHIPFIAWFSNDFKHNHKINMHLLRNTANKAYSHDNVSHSLLSLFNVETEEYSEAENIFKKYTEYAGSGL